MGQGSFDDSCEERKLLIAVVGLLFAALCFSFIKSYFPGFSSCLTLTNPDPAQAAPAAAKTNAHVSQEKIVFPVNINTADAVQLQQLPGIGPVLAQRIIEYRQAHGEFKDAGQLIEVKGIGPKTLARFKDKISL